MEFSITSKGLRLFRSFTNTICRSKLPAALRKAQHCFTTASRRARLFLFLPASQ
jgi:hypothetical protein